MACDVCVTVREESGFAVNSIKESQNESLNHSNDSISSVGDIAEFSDEEEVPSGEYFTSCMVKQSSNEESNKTVVFC